jgi:hypothetical protein
MKSFKQIVENIVVLDEAVMDQKMWDQTKKGDKLTISYDSGIKKGNKATFVVGTKNIVGKAKVGKITMKRDDGKGGKFFLYNRNGSISLALGDMAASMTGLVKESVTVELDENKNLIKDYEKYMSQGGKKDHNAIDYLMSMPKYKRMSKDQMAKTIGDAKRKGIFREEVELDERNYAKEYANYHSRPEQIANRSSRNKARRIVAKENDVDGMDVGHADNNPLNNDPANLRIENPSDNRREPRMRNEGKNSNYELYHKDFSGAMQTAYTHAKKNLGIIVDPSEIDDKVAMGPRKPSTGKTNSYRLTDKSGKKAIQVQVYNTGKSYELNMYKEDLDEAVELDEAPRRKGAPKIKPDFLKVQRAKDAEHNAAMGRTKTGRKKPVRTMTSTQKSLASMRRECAEVLDEKEYDPYAKSTKRAVQHANANQKVAKARNDAVKTSREVKSKRDLAASYEEVQHIQESFKAGGLKLKDGKQVMVKKDDATMLNDLMKQLSKPNVKKMTDTAMKNKKGYAEILGFARDSHE